MKVNKYVAKFIVDAIQYDGNNMHEVLNFIKGKAYIISECGFPEDKHYVFDYQNKDNIKHKMELTVGSYVVENAYGFIIVIPKTTFETTHKPYNE